MAEEGSLEKSFNRLAAKHFFLSVKLIAQGKYGFPDRTCFGLGSHIFFVELKAEGKKPKRKQFNWHKNLKRMGFRCYVCDTKKQAKEIFEKEKGIQTERQRTLDRSRLSKGGSKAGLLSKIPGVLSRPRARKNHNNP